MEEIKLNEIYEYLIDNERISVETLKNFGLDEYDILKLTKNGNLKRVEDYFVLTDSEKGPYASAADCLLNAIAVELIIKCLNNKENELASAYIRNYLNIIGKNQYLELITNLLKIDCLNGVFTETVDILKKISKCQFNLNSDDYLNKYIKALEEGKMDIVRLYSEVMVDIDCINDSDIDFDFQKTYEV